MKPRASARWAVARTSSIEIGSGERCGSDMPNLMSFSAMAAPHFPSERSCALAIVRPPRRQVQAGGEKGASVTRALPIHLSSERLLPAGDFEHDAGATDVVLDADEEARAGRVEYAAGPFGVQFVQGSDTDAV